MTPEEWNQGLRNEAGYAEDAAWAAEARRCAHIQRWRADLGGFLLGLLIVQVSLLLMLARALFFLAHPQADPHFGLWWTLNVALMAPILAFLAGLLGYRAWPVALAFAAAPPLAQLTAWPYRTCAHDLALTLSLDGWVWILGLQVVVASLAVAFGRRFSRRRRLA